MTRDRTPLKLMTAACALSAFAALGLPGAASAASKKDTLIDGTTDTVTALDPAGQYDYGSDTADREIFQHLMGLPAGGGTPVPELATKCSADDSQTTWTCELRKGVKFSNGDDFTSEDVKFSFDRVVKIHDASGIWGLLANMKEVATDGPDKVVFHLKNPQSTWPYILATSAGYIVDHKVYPADKLQPSTSPQVGTGPYKLVKYVPSQIAVYKAREDFWGTKPKIPNLIINYFAKSSTMKLALQKGEIDMAFRSFSPTELTSLQGAKGIKVHKGPGVSIRYLTLDTKRAPTNKLAVRQALAYLMPREAIAKQVYHGFVQPLYSMVPAGLPGHEDAFAKMYGKTPDKAKAAEVLKKAGIKTPVDLTIWWTPSHYGAASAEEFTQIQRAMNASGLFKITLKSAEWATYSKTLGTQYDAFQLGWFPDYPDAENYLTPFYESDSNFTSNGYDSKDMDAILTKEKGAKTDEERMKYVKEAQDLAAKDVPIIPYFQQAMVAVARDNVHGIDKTLDTTFLMRFWMLSKS
ncbi:ABC transporter substrate-binding protein [Acidimangrovimonas sediminis]|uniref:ABC transporter substrate-binding protein n=1 Tax=Acidimangrovimonas sediminis TaxID=2056283 RepID=UPI000C8051B6|nr:ABC transporter substrate-binding protein [Acidimangrovimonas sediminis]